MSIQGFSERATHTPTDYSATYFLNFSRNSMIISLLAITIFSTPFCIGAWAITTFTISIITAAASRS